MKTRLGLFASLLASLLLSPLLPASATPSASNPLDDHGWPIFEAGWEGAYGAWQNATGTNKDLLAKIARQPRVIWLTNGSNPSTARRNAEKRIAEFHRTTPEGYAQLAVFGLYPDGENRRKEPFTAAMQARYKTWINETAAGIGDKKVILILEPDLAVAYTGYRPWIRFRLAKYAAQVFSKLPNTIVYLDGSDADWLPATKAVDMLTKAGVQYTRGIALGSTHYASASWNIQYGGRLVRMLAARGIKGKKFVIDTADNGVPYTHKQYYAAHPGGAFDNANVCRTKTEKLCLTLGIPPTTRTASARWGMPLRTRNIAATYCDAFLWFGRPWLNKQAYPFDLNRALGVAATTRWQ